MYITVCSMLRKVLFDEYQQIGCQTLRLKNKLNYSTFFALCIERHPVITQQRNELEENLSMMLAEMESEKGKKSNFELQKESESNHSEYSKEEYIKQDFNNPFKQSTHDLEEYRRRELNQLRTDATAVTNSSGNKLNGSSFLVLKQEIKTSDGIWFPPKGIVEHNESIKQAVKRISKSSCGDNFEAFFYGNAPIGFQTCFNEEYVDKDTKIFKHKIFYFLAKYIGGFADKDTEHQWLNMYEMKNILPRSVYKNIFHSLMISK